MTNTPQTMLAEPSAEHPQEEVQLTELRPVEQSRIKLLDDDAPSDGFRALRSFASRQPDELEQFGFPGKQREFAEEPHGAKNGSERQSEEEEYYGVNGDFEYLEEKNEIYKYQPESGRDSESEPETKVLALLEEKKRKKEEKKKKKESEEVVFAATPRRGRPFRGYTKPKKSKLLCKPPEPPRKPTPVPPEVSEKELQSKMNDLIEANFLLEQENNNIVDEEADKSQETELTPVKRKYRRKMVEEPKKYSCKMCKAGFKGSGGLRTHYKVVHHTGPLFKCDDCGKEFPLKERLKLHVRTHTGFKPYKCPECDKSFARGGQLVQHRRTHSQVKAYSCELCGGTFTCAANLALHLKRHTGQKDHKCEICGRGFVRRDALKKHLECLHQDVKSFLCNICNKTFKGHLPQHMRTHAQDRPHGCATCGQRFAQKSQLTVHQRTHSGQRPFRCLVCWQAFAHSTALKLHTRRHTGERPFKCAECNAGFTQLPHWKKHMRCIHGRTEPYSCRRCNSFFRTKNDLDNHGKDCTIDEANNDSSSLSGSETGNSGDGLSPHALAKYRIMPIEKVRLLLAVLLKRISKQERLDELGFGKRLIDEVLVDSLISAGKTAVKPNGLLPEFDALRKNLAVFLEWTVPKEHWASFCKMNKAPEQVLEILTSS